MKRFLAVSFAAAVSDIYPNAERSAHQRKPVPALRIRDVLLFLTAFLIFSVAICAQTKTSVTTEMRQEANDFYQKQDWVNAVKSYEKIVDLEDANLSARYRYGLSLLNLNKNAEAQTQLEKVFTASPNAILAFALARAYARTNNSAKMYETIEKSTKMGGISPDNLTTEKDFAQFQNEPKFKELVAKSDLAFNPCKASPEFRQFDFWVGEWNAKNAQGITVGSSSIQLILGQCVIFENWNTSVTSGKSFSIFDATDKKWHQTWVNDKGVLTHYTGGLEDGKMVLVSESVVNGVKTLNRMTYSKLANGDVRQYGDASTDDGKTWKQTFDFTYTKKI